MGAGRGRARAPGPVHRHPARRPARGRDPSPLGRIPRRRVRRRRCGGGGVVGDRGWRTAGVAAAFLAPSLVVLLGFWIGPMLGTIWISLQNWNLIGKARFAGVDNYTELAQDKEFHAALGHTLVFIASYVPLVLVGGLAVALLLDGALPAMRLFRAIFFIPVISSWGAVSLLWKWILNPADGLLDRALAAIGIEGPGWWTSPDWAMPAIVLASVWKDVGYVAVLLLAGLQAIPGELKEAAQLDGPGAC